MIVMSVADLRVLRRKLETDLQAHIARLVSDFQEKTGIGPSSIDVQMLDITTVSDVERQSLVGRVRVEVQI